MSILLGVNIDHVATLRQARGTRYPELSHAAALCEQAGADAITIHLREDRRHIQDRDVYLLKETLQTRMNLEMAVTEEMIRIACDVKPSDVCLVPEKRAELTTEGGLDVQKNEDRITEAVERLGEAGIRVSLFIDPVENQIEAASHTSAPVVEIHTGAYAEAKNEDERDLELGKIIHAAKFADDAGLTVNGGHGLHYHNTEAIAAIPQVCELNIGHAIVSRAVFTGLDVAVREMKHLMRAAR